MLYLSLHNKIIIPNCITILYVDTSVKTPTSLTSSTTLLVSTSSTFTLSDSLITPTPTVPQGILTTINKMKLFINKYRFMSIT